MGGQVVRHVGWQQPERDAALPHAAERGRGITVTDRGVHRDGVAVVPVTGEVHFSRLPRARWAERLRAMRAGGVTAASTYVFWNHHVAERGRPRFDGELDIVAFIDEVDAAGLDLVLRIGPWAHGEARHGGFPDWVQHADVRHRTDDPGYLTLVSEWFAQLADALDGRARPGGPVIAIQVENELYDRPRHLSTLIDLARAAGMSAPLWTATAWGGAQLPAGEVFPLFGGYADGFWVDPDGDWQPNFRAHFFASHDWDDPGVGDDVRATQGFAAQEFTTLEPTAQGSTAQSSAAQGSTAQGSTTQGSHRAELHGFPPATCELGSGMATAYHRRPVLAARDIAALAHVKIGNGSAWQGYYMYAGGRNPRRGLQETQDTGYPNDLPEIGYDFHAPLSQAGDLQPSARELRAQHAFLAAFGDRLGRMTSSLPEERPQGLGDRSTLRWALRSDGEEGFVIISHHQPYEQVEPVIGAQLSLVLADEVVTVPSRPVDIPAGTLTRWPVGLRVGATRVRWVTASALTVLPAAGTHGPTLVVTAESGIPVEVCVEGERPRVVGPGDHPIGEARLLVLDRVDDAWVRGATLYDTDGELAWDDAVATVRNASRVRRFDPRTRRWENLPAGKAPEMRPVAVSLRRPDGDVPVVHAKPGERHRAPSASLIEDRAAVFHLDLGDDDGTDVVLDLDWTGDVAQLRVDGELVDDRFWDGETWSVSLRDVGIVDGSEVTVHILPMAAGSTVWLPPSAPRAAAVAAAVTSARLRFRTPWHPLPSL